MNCKYCGLKGKLVKAHVLPASFYAHLQVGRDSPAILPADADAHLMKSPIGEYDPEMLCEVCEPKFSTVDGSGKKFFLDTDWLTVPRHRVFANCVLEVPGADYRLIKLFILSVLLRAHWSTRPFHGVVDLGAHEKSILEMIDTGNAGDMDKYAVVLYRYEPTSREQDPKLSWRAPLLTECEGVAVWIIRFREFGAIIKVDHRPLPEVFSVVALAPSEPVRLIARNYMASPERHQLLNQMKARSAAEKSRGKQH